MMRGMSFSLIAPGARGLELKRRLVSAIDTAYTENAARYAPDDLGDNYTTFGVSITHNLRHLAELAVDGLERIEVERPQNSFRLRIDGRYALYLYKAPPAARSIRELRFDESEMKLQIAQGNADQLQLDLDGVLPSDTRLNADELPAHAVVVHFGAPETGFDFATVGAPYRTASGACEWAWSEAFELPDAAEGQHEEEVVSPRPADDFGLRLRARETASEDAKGPT